ncbi:MAG: RidA family protein [Rhodovulum sp.]|nr:RidA family protein [Rhodovulum sp.]
MHTILHPEGWTKPLGYANGVVARGRTIFVAGQVGWTPAQTFASDDLVDQIRQCLLNIVAVLREAGAEPAHIVSMTWYFVDKDEYLARSKEIGAAYRDVIGRWFPAMTAMQVAALVEEGAKVEIQATAVLPD